MPCIGLIAQLLTADGFVDAGRFRLPLFQGSPPESVIADVAKVGAAAALRNGLLENAIRYVDDAWTVVRLCDPRRRGEYPVEVRLLLQAERECIYIYIYILYMHSLPCKVMVLWVPVC